MSGGISEITALAEGSALRQKARADQEALARRLAKDPDLTVNEILRRVRLDHHRTRALIREVRG